VKRKHPKWTHGYIDQHGKPRFYCGGSATRRYRFQGSRVPGFMQAREAASRANGGKIEIGASRTVLGTINAGMVSYYQSSAFKDGLAGSTQSSRRAILERFREEHGDTRIVKMHDAALQAILNGKTPAAQRNWKKVLRGFIDHCLSLKIIKIDPLTGVLAQSVTRLSMEAIDEN
jgi:hypothetical protein